MTELSDYIVVDFSGDTASAAAVRVSPPEEFLYWEDADPNDIAVYGEQTGVPLLLPATSGGVPFEGVQDYVAVIDTDTGQLLDERAITLALAADAPDFSEEGDPVARAQEALSWISDHSAGEPLVPAEVLNWTE